MRAGPGQAERNRRAHVRARQLRQHRAVAIVDERVDDRLRMHHHLELGRLDREQMIGLDQLQALVHQGGRVDRDLAPHRPVGVAAAPPAAWRAPARSRLQVRNGPPEAVSTMRSMEAGSAPAIAWKTAECSESTGTSSVPAARTASMKISPASTRHSLLASATRRPCATAASVGLQAGRTDDAGHHAIGGRTAALDERGGAGRHLDAAAGQALLERAVAALVGDDGQRGAVPHGQLGQRLHVAVGGQRHDLEQVRSCGR